MPLSPLSPLRLPTTRFNPRVGSFSGTRGTQLTAADMAGSGTVLELALIPRITDKTVLEPIRRFSERVEDPLNALQRAGILVRLGPASWTIDLTATTGAGVTGEFGVR